ncbi:NAD(P)-dependent oxidoreductase [Cellulomonas sp. Leaf334]|uniref:NAD(P)-dependent oxidoreductase n=1 Tax=Cellulomonas sp. Leaf334 TaxID=1736339 RepID=UPI0006FCEA4F|nr:NAD(P)H-binding protein [Cellulomonas sp. Leaf334]KQR17245.1 hypothetical protein ASF78_08085 [Cellulomonas sp. Leaf334]
MRIAVLGATGRTGALLVDSALRRGHSVNALARDRAQLTGRPDIRAVIGDARARETLTELLQGAQAVISTLGPRGRDHTLQTTVATTLVDAMTESGVHRFIGVSVAGLDVPGDHKGNRDKVIGALVRTLARGAARDRAGEFTAWQNSDRAWTLVRVPRLVDGPTTQGSTSTPTPHRGAPPCTALHWRTSWSTSPWTADSTPKHRSLETATHEPDDAQSAEVGSRCRRRE